MESPGPLQLRLATARRLENQGLLQTAAQSLYAGSAIAVLIGGMAWLQWHDPSAAVHWAVFVGLIFLMVLCGYGHRLSNRHPFGASVALVLGQLGIVAAGLMLFRASAVGYFAAIPAMIAAVLFSPGVSVAVLALALASLRLGLPQDGAWVAPAVLATLTAASAWLLMRPIRHLLVWSLRRGVEATYLMEEMQVQRGKLNRAMKALDLTNHLLQRTNRELELARREAEKARQLKAEFAANISHELRTPLNLILGFTEIMSRSPEVYGDVNWTPRLRQDIATIRRNARHLSDFVDDILDLARVEALRLPIQREATDLLQVIREVAEIVQGLLEGRPVSLRLLLPSTLPELYIDGTRVRQVLLNLLANACRFTEKGSITVSAVMQEDEVVVSVTDTGVGIPEEQLQHVFDQFYQVGSWRRPESKGSGLGLAIAKEFIQLHGGRIWAESRVGEGSTFSFSLPLLRKDVARLHWSGDAALPARREGACILVVGAGEPTAAYLRRHLGDCTVKLAGSAAEVQSCLREGPADAVLVNIPPESDALGHCRHDLPLPTGLPVIGCSLPGDATPRQDPRFTACLSKPISGEKLLSLVQGLAPEGEILVVDDEREFVRFVRRNLETIGQGGRMRAAYDGEQALKELQRHRPALVLLDLVLGPTGGSSSMDGFTLAEAIRRDERLAGVPVVAISGANLGEEAQAAHGDCFFLSRTGGFRRDELLSLIKSALTVLRPVPSSGGSVAALPETAAATQAS